MNPIHYRIHFSLFLFKNEHPISKDLHCSGRQLCEVPTFQISYFIPFKWRETFEEVGNVHSASLGVSSNSLYISIYIVHI